MMQMNQMMMGLFRRPFGPEEELEADRDGITWAYRAGYDPRALAGIYQALEAAGKDQPNFMPAFFRTHPLTAERRENLTQTYAELQAAEPKAKLYLGRENLARRLTRAQREFPE
jgi:predicted Zn-dependent protease